MPKKRGSQGKRYTGQQRAKILAAAKKEGLTGAQVAKRFGISTLTFYRWRGPVRSDALARRGKRGSGRPKGVGKGAALERELRAEIRKRLPQIIREEVAAALGQTRA